MTEGHHGASGDIDWETVYEGDARDTPVDHHVVRIASGLSPGTALDLGCGPGQNSIRRFERAR